MAKCLCFNYSIGSGLTAINFFNIPYSIEKGRYLSLNPLSNAGGVISV